jgi:hypothetical protein
MFGLLFIQYAIALLPSHRDLERAAIAAFPSSSSA